MSLSHGAWYLVPDGRRVQAHRSETITPLWAFVTADGQPAYISTPEEEILQFVLDPATSEYRTVPCALTFNDFRPISLPSES